MSITMFDLDGPLARCVEQEFFIWANNHADVVVPWDYQILVETGDWIAATSMLPTEITRIYHEFTLSSAYPGFKPTPGAIQALNTIPAEHRFIATARHQLLSDVTERFLDEHYGPFSAYYFNVHQAKIELVKKLQPRFVIDDSYPLLLAMARETATVPILFPKPTTRDIDPACGVLVLEVESTVTSTMSRSDFDHVCVYAWREITKIIS